MTNAQFLLINYMLIIISLNATDTLLSGFSVDAETPDRTDYGEYDNASVGQLAFTGHKTLASPVPEIVCDCNIP